MKQTLKKIIGLILTCLMILSLAACGTSVPAQQPSQSETPGSSTPSASTPAPSQSNQPVQLVLWSIATESDAFHNAYNKAIADFEKANAGVTIIHETFENESYKT